MKKKDKICPQCKESYTPTRSDQIYCYDTCRWNAWRERKAKGQLSGIPETKEPEIDISAKLRGVVDWEEVSGEKSFLPKDANAPSSGENVSNAPLFDLTTEEKLKDVLANKDKADTFIKRVCKLMEECDRQIAEAETHSTKNREEKLVYSEYEMDFVPADGYQKPSDWIDNDFEDDEFTKEFNEEKRKQKLASLQKMKGELVEQFELGKKMQEEVENALGSINSEMKKQKGQAILRLLEGIQNKKIQQQGLNGIKQNEMNQNNDQPPQPKNKRVMNLREIKELKFKNLTFQGRWKDFIGLPSTHFHLAIHGLPGQGKSTFCILFAEYLAENFGEVMYVSGEQGFEKTLQDIINRTGANSDKIDFSDPRHYDEVYTCVERNKYNFIFIDSLNTLQIDEKRLKKLKEYYSQSAFITISQSTKDGKMKGNNEILHDADTVIGVHKGMATTSKNRFNVSDRHFEVF